MSVSEKEKPPRNTVGRVVIPLEPLLDNAGMATKALMELAKRLGCSSQTSGYFLPGRKAGMEIGNDAPGINGVAPTVSSWWLSRLERQSSISLPTATVSFIKRYSDPMRMGIMWNSSHQPFDSVDEVTFSKTF